MNIDLTKYTFVTHTRKDGRVEVIAISTFAGKPVRGKAICAQSDTFDYQKGQELAAARCNDKIAVKRYNRAKQKLAEAEKAVADAAKFYDAMRHYQEDAFLAKLNASKIVKETLSEL